MSIKKILIPTDFSEAARNAVNYALNFIEEGDQIEMTLLHVISPDVDQEEVDEMAANLEKLDQELSSNPDLRLTRIMRHGDLTTCVLEVQQEVSADLIVIGTKGASGEEVHTNTSRIVTEVDCPVLVIPQQNDGFALKNIALALGRNEIDDTFSLSVLHNIARKFGAKVHILTISREDDSNSIDKNESVLEYYLETLDYQYSFPKNTDIEKGIFDYVKEKSIDMLAILPRNHAKKSKPSEGRLTKLLTLHTELPLLTID